MLFGGLVAAFDPFEGFFAGYVFEPEMGSACPAAWDVAASAARVMADRVFFMGSPDCRLAALCLHGRRCFSDG